MIQTDERTKVKNIVVIPHTHWDREWFNTFQQFRFYLVEFMDQLIDTLEKDADFKHFLLDGQMILIEDYLEIRPENKERLYRLIQDGRIQIGPWYAQPDEFLVSGEALVRNLLIGDRLAKAIAEPMKQGYIPDTFGHIAQLPQILNGFGIETFYFWRGLGENIEDLKTEFWWEGPDGSRLFSHYLSESYSNAGLLADTPEKMSIHHGKNVSYENMDELVGYLAGRTESGTLLFLNGSDHLTVQDDFTHHVRSLDSATPYRIYNGTLEDFQRNVLESGAELKTLRGELRYGRYHPVLKDVLSTRMYIKQWNERAQQLLENRVERFATMIRVRGGKDHSSFITYAWKELLKNHPHDSICGCSIDQVHREMMSRYYSVIEVGEKVLDESLNELARMVSANGQNGEIPVVAFNPSPWKRSGEVNVEVLLVNHSPLGERMFGFNSPSRDISLSDYILVDSDGSALPFRSSGDRVNVEDVLQRRKVVYRERIHFYAEHLPAMGHQVYKLVPKERYNFKAAAAAAPSSASEWNGGPVLNNGLLQVVPHSDGTLTVKDLRNGKEYDKIHVFLDEADAGDEYTYSEPLEQKVVRSDSVQWRVYTAKESHTLVMEGEFVLPAALTEDRKTRRTDTKTCKLMTYVRLLPGSERLEFRTVFDNQAEDHRLRVVFPTGIPTERSTAETSFGLVSRPVVPEPSEGWREKNTATFAQRRFVTVEGGNVGVAVLNKGLPEYEVKPDGSIYLTLIRAVGWLSREDLLFRKGNAGPALETKDAQCKGTLEFEYAVVFYEASEDHVEIFKHAEDFHIPLEARSVQYKTEVNLCEDEAPFMEILKGGIVLSTMKKAEDNDATVVRLYNPSDRAVDAVVRFGRPINQVRRANLNEEQLDEGHLITMSGHEVALTFQPNKIETLLITFA